MAKDSAVRIEIGRSFHQLGHSPGKGPWEWFGTSLGWHHKVSFTCRTQAFWRAHKFELASLGILVQCQLWSCRQTSVPWIWCERLLVASVTWWREGYVSFFGSLIDHSGCCILDQLQRLDSTCGKARQESITIVQSGETRAWTRSCNL